MNTLFPIFQDFIIYIFLSLFMAVLFLFTNFVSRYVWKKFYQKISDIQAYPILFVCLFIFAISLNYDLWYHDHFGLDKVFSPTHIPFYLLTPVIFLLVLKITVGVYRKRLKVLQNMATTLLLGLWFAISGLIINYFWHSFGLVETYAAPPHLLFFAGLFLLLVSSWKIYQQTSKVAIATHNKNFDAFVSALFYLSLLAIILILLGWNDHAEDFGGSGFVDLSREFETKHPHPDVQSLIGQIAAIRQISPFLIPAVFMFIFSYIATNILRRKIFPGALTLIFLTNFLIRSIFHFPAVYIPIMIIPMITLDILTYIYPTIVNKNYFPFIMGGVFSIIFYSAYYPFSMLVSGISWPIYLVIEVPIVSFFMAATASWLGRYTKII